MKRDHLAHRESGGERDPVRGKMPIGSLLCGSFFDFIPRACRAASQFRGNRFDHETRARLFVVSE